MRLIWISILIFLASTMPSYAENSLVDKLVSDFIEMNTDELIDLRERIEEELLRRGVVSYFDLELNSKGDDVANLQKRLAELGYYKGNITGKYDSATRQAEKQFEKANNLENDGVASHADQVVLFSEAALPKMTAVPQVNSTVSPDIKIESNVEDYGELDYEDTMRYPEKHKGEKVVLNGKVIQVIGSRSIGFQIRFSISGSSDVVYVYVNDIDYNILENDRMTIYATVKGIKTYSSIFNQSITIPSLQADCVILK